MSMSNGNNAGANRKSEDHMWMKYDTNEEIGKRIIGISKKASVLADNASGIVRHPKTGERIYWSGK